MLSWFCFSSFGSDDLFIVYNETVNVLAPFESITLNNMHKNICIYFYSVYVYIYQSFNVVICVDLGRFSTVSIIMQFVSFINDSFLATFVFNQIKLNWHSSFPYDIAVIWFCLLFNIYCVDLYEYRSLHCIHTDAMFLYDFWIFFFFCFHLIYLINSFVAKHFKSDWYLLVFGIVIKCKSLIVLIKKAF